MANIFSQFIQPIKSVDDWQAEADAKALRGEQLKGVQRQNALADLVGQQQRQTMADTAADRNALATLAAGWNANTTPDQRIMGLRNSGRPALMQQADALEKQWLDRRKTESDVGKNDADAAGKRQQTAEDRRKATILQVASFGQPQDAVEALNMAVRNGEMPMQMATLIQRGIPQDPAEFRTWQLRMVAGVADPAKMVELLKPQIQTNNTGGFTTTQAIDPLTGKPTITGQIKNTQSPDNAATVGASYANANATRAIAEATRDAAKITADQKSETDLRKEFADLPEVKNFKTAAPAYKAVVEAAKGNNPQADINLIYGLAKLYDPNSVVREGEYATIANSQSIPEWLKGHAQRLTGGGRLTDATKKQILEQAAIRYKTMEGDMNGAQASYDGIATRRGLKPENVFPRVGGGSRPDSPLTEAEQAELKKLREQLGRK